MCLTDVQKQVSLIIKPKDRKKIEQTSQDLNSNVDPVNLNITNIVNMINGTIIIQSETDEGSNKIKNAIRANWVKYMMLKRQMKELCQ